MDKPRWLLLAGLVAVSLTFTSFAGAPSAEADQVAYSPIDMAEATPTPAPPCTPAVWLPIVRRPHVCQPVAGASYADTPASGYPPGDPPANEHPDLNLSLRGWQANGDAYLGLVDYTGSADLKAPQLVGLFADQRAPTITAGYRVYDWNWNTNTRGPLLRTYPVTLAGLAATPGETVHVPASGYSIGGTQNFEVLVLYADEDSITLKYTRDDNVVQGYTLHLEGLCVEPSLLKLYEDDNAAGRSRLPGLTELQALGRAEGNEVRVAIRDNGTFMDPRSHKDWWQTVTTTSQAVEQQLSLRHDVLGTQ